ncbi:hypothetical protein II906_01065, partial [bacterium]|nr:hypothetical protein [bacterium]
GQMSFSAEANAQAGAQTFFGRDADGKMVSVTYDPQTQTYTADGKECNYDRVTGVVNYNE